MKLTPLDIRHKEFKRGMRGYADVEVDEFLDEIADEFERLFKENIDLQDRVEALEEKVSGYKRIEETLQKTLVNAQASAEEQKQNANKQAQLILQDAELKARQMVNEAYSERQAIEQTMAKLRSAEEDFRFKFRQLLDGYLRQLQETPEVTQAEAPAADLSRHTEAIKEAIARESAPELDETPAPAPQRTATPEPTPAAQAPAPQRTATPEPEPATRTSEPPRTVTPEPEPVTQAPTSRSQPAARPAPDTAPARGPGGVQAGVPAQPAAQRAATPEDTVSQPARPPADDAEVTATRPPAAPGENDQARREERARLGEADDLLADVDTGVNENEFKW
jgi:cell division initiation protein